MRFASFASAFQLLAVAQAFVIPAGTTEGVYAVTTRSDGTVEHVKLSAPETKRQIILDPPSTGNPTTPENRIWCGCGFNMDHGNCDNAVADLKKQMQPAGFVNAGTAYYAIRDNVVAFACYRDKTPNTAFLLFSSAYADALARISKACGDYVAGSMNIGAASKQMIVGYQKYKAGDDFCTSSTWGSASKC